MFSLTSRRAATKKRHTKPCRFYQTSRCPLSAEECDFAHVYSNEALQSPKPCRYFAAGKCSNGPSCRYRHVATDAGAIEQPIGSEAELSPDFRVKNEPAQTMFDDVQSGVDLGLQKASSSDLSSTYDASMLGHSYSTMYATPPYSQWPHNAYSSSPNFYLSTPQQYAPDYASPTLSADTLSISTSNSSSSQNDDNAFVTEDPGYPEHLHQCQSRLRLAEEPMVHYAPTMYRYPASVPHLPVLTLDTSYHTLMTPPNPYPNYQPSYLSPTSPGTPNIKRRSRSSTRSKAAHYKTKPCKFFKKSKTCPNGDECTFIHDESPIRTESAAAAAATNSPVKDLPPGLPPKPVSMAEENKKKNFYPISWRVIGGGVMMGDPKSSIQFPVDESVPVVKRPEEEEQESNEISSSGPSLTPDSTDTVQPSRMVRRRSSSSPPMPTQNRKEADFSAET